mmetsp:Transcript_61711/g.143589  ORF Transcript_61711/g.143589 Transcript_61711/m.143589 type:complete len:225 (+) Transcript_61711:238-912(+)
MMRATTTAKARLWQRTLLEGLVERRAAASEKVVGRATRVTVVTTVEVGTAGATAAAATRTGASAARVAAAMRTGAMAARAAALARAVAALARVVAVATRAAVARASAAIRVIGRARAARATEAARGSADLAGLEAGKVRRRNVVADQQRGGCPAWCACATGCMRGPRCCYGCCAVLHMNGVANARLVCARVGCTGVACPCPAAASTVAHVLRIFVRMGACTVEF